MTFSTEKLLKNAGLTKADKDALNVLVFVQSAATMAKLSQDTETKAELSKIMYKLAKASDGGEAMARMADRFDAAFEAVAAEYQEAAFDCMNEAVDRYAVTTPDRRRAMEKLLDAAFEDEAADAAFKAASEKFVESTSSYRIGEMLKAGAPTPAAQSTAEPTDEEMDDMISKFVKSLQAQGLNVTATKITP